MRFCALRIQNSEYGSWFDERDGWSGPDRPAVRPVLEWYQALLLASLRFGRLQTLKSIQSEGESFSVVLPLAHDSCQSPLGARAYRDWLKEQSQFQ